MHYFASQQLFNNHRAECDATHGAAVTSSSADDSQATIQLHNCLICYKVA